MILYRALQVWMCRLFRVLFVYRSSFSCQKSNCAQRQKTYRRTWVSRKDFDQPAHFARSDQNLHWAHSEFPKMQSFFMRTTMTQAAWMRRLIWVYVGRTCAMVRFLTLRINEYTCKFIFSANNPRVNKYEYTMTVVQVHLYLSIGKFSRRQIDLLLNFQRKQDLIFPLETICMKCQIPFSGGYKKNAIICRLLKILPSRSDVKNIKVSVKIMVFYYTSLLRAESSFIMTVFLSYLLTNCA